MEEILQAKVNILIRDRQGGDTQRLRKRPCEDRGRGWQCSHKQGMPGATETGRSEERSLPFSRHTRELQSIMVSDRSQTQGHILYDAIYMKFLEKAELQKQWSPGARAGRRDRCEQGCGRFGGRRKCSQTGLRPCSQLYAFMKHHQTVLLLQWVGFTVCQLYLNETALNFKSSSSFQMFEKSNNSKKCR